MQGHKVRGSLITLEAMIAIAIAFAQWGPRVSDAGVLVYVRAARRGQYRRIFGTLKTGGGRFWERTLAEVGTEKGSAGRCQKGVQKCDVRNQTRV